MVNNRNYKSLMRVAVKEECKVLFKTSKEMVKVCRATKKSDFSEKLIFKAHLVP